MQRIKEMDWKSEKRYIYHFEEGFELNFPVFYCAGAVVDEPGEFRGEFRKRRTLHVRIDLLLYVHELAVPQPDLQGDIYNPEFCDVHCEVLDLRCIPLLCSEHVHLDVIDITFTRISDQRLDLRNHSMLLFLVLRHQSHDCVYSAYFENMLVVLHVFGRFH